MRFLEESPELRIVDSLIIASRLAKDVDLFISNEEHFKKDYSKWLFSNL